MIHLHNVFSPDNRIAIYFVFKDDISYFDLPLNENGMLFTNSKHVGIDMPIDQLVRNVLDFILRAIIKCFTDEV